MARASKHPWIAAIVLLAACRSRATQITVSVATSVEPTRAMTLRIHVVRGAVTADAARAARDNPVQAPPGGALFPGTFALVPPSGTDRDDVITMLAQLEVAPSQSAPGLVIERLQRVRFVPRTPQAARVFFNVRCGDRATDCETALGDECTVSRRCIELGATCGDEGECVELELPTQPSTDAGSLPDASAAIDARVIRSDAASRDVSIDQSSDGALRDASVDRASDSGAALSVRAISPLSTHMVTSARPTLRFDVQGTAQRLEIQLCRNRALTAGCVHTPIAAVTDRTFRPATDLARGWWFWTVIASDDRGDATSPVWQLLVPGALPTGSVDTSYPAPLDFNGDGFGDLAVGLPASSGTTGVAIYFGNMSGIQTNTPVIISNPGIDRFGETVANGGDLNGDGRSDLIVGSRSGAGSSPGSVTVVFGAASGAPAMQTLSNGVGADQFGIAVAAAGDVDGDGLSDVLVGANQSGVVGQAGYATLIKGGPPFAVAPRIRLVDAAPSAAVGAAVSGIGDINLDGYADFAVGAPLASDRGLSDCGQVNVYLGRPDLTAITLERSIFGSAANQRLGSALACAGDTDGDGDSEFVIAGYHSTASSPTDPLHANDRGVVALYRWPDLSTAATNLRFASMATGFSVAGAGDINGDGLCDILVGSPFANAVGAEFYGEVRAYFGAAAGLNGTTSMSSNAMTGSRSRLGHAVAIVGRIDAAPRADVAVAAPGIVSAMPFVEASVPILRLVGTTLPTPPLATIATVASGARFGVSLSSSSARYAGD